MKDIINRQDVIDMLMSENRNEPRYPEWYASKVEEIEEVRDMEPKRPEGHWEITEAYPHNVYCSNCHKKFAQTQWSVWEDGSLSRNFCSNCGAQMIGGEARDH